jgi:hypothetical protein
MVFEVHLDHSCLSHQLADLTEEPPRGLAINSGSMSLCWLKMKTAPIFAPVGGRSTSHVGV